jgi:hypothetical protein
MRLLVLKLGVFALMFIMADVGIGRIVKSVYASTRNTNLYNANYGFLKSNDKDVLFFGGSEISHSIDSNLVTEKTGLASYNLASDGCGILYQYPLLQTVLDGKKPKAVLISSMQLNDTARTYISRMYPYYNENKYVKTIVDKFLPDEYIKLIFKGYVYNSQIFRILDSSNSANILKFHGYIPLGIVGMQNSKAPLPTGGGYDIDSDNIYYFHQFIDLATKSGVKVYVLIPPVREVANLNYLNRVHGLLSNKNVTVLDFSRDMDFLNDASIYNDMVHLNSLGAEKLTSRIIDTINKDKALYQ